MNIGKFRLSAKSLPAAAFVLSASIAAPAFAQQATLEEVTVTARKTAESLQDVPLTVTAISGSEMKKFDYSKIEDVVARIPTLNVQIGGSGSGAQVTLRGVGSSNISAAFDSAVALDFDGMQVSSMRVLQSSFFDVEQIEVLKGPQSLFFGKSASAGVISIKSANPTDEFEVGGKALYEIEEQGYTGEAYVSGPITDELGFRLAARYNNISKQYVNLANDIDPNTERNKGQENLLFRATFQWDPADEISVNLKLNYVGHKNDGGIQNAVLDCNANGVADTVLHPLGLPISPGYECDHKRKKQWRFNGAPDLVRGGTPDTDLNEGRPFGDSDIIFGILRWDWDISDDLTLTHVSGYLDQTAQDNDWYSYGGVCVSQATCPWYGTQIGLGTGPGADPANGLPVLDNTSYALGGGITDHQVEQITQELRLASNYDAPVNFMFGFFYEDRHTEFNTNQYAVNFATLFGPSSETGPDAAGYTSDWYKKHLYDMRAVSIFGQITWDITDQLEFAGGVRWTDERKRNNVEVPYMHWAGPALLGAVPSGFDTGDIIFKDSNISPEASLTWAATEDVNLYVSYKTGFKSGGIDNSALPSAGMADFGSADPAVRAAAAAGLIYDSETAKGFETGMKAVLFDQTLRLNVSGYYYVFKNLQVQNFDPFAIQFQTGNASELTNKGLELDFNWITPADGVSVYGTVALTSTKYTKPFDPNPNNAIPIELESIEGRSAARAPSFAGNLAVDYRRPVGNSFEFGMTGNVAFSSSYWTNEDSLTDTKQKSYATFDLAVSLGDADGAWQFAVIGRNLGDKRAITTSGGRPFLIAGVGDDEVWNLTRGRQVFMEAKFQY